MPSLNELKRRGIIPLLALGLAAYYVLVYVPLKHRAAQLDEPLARAWQRLSVSLEQSTNSPVDFILITNQLAETRRALTLLQQGRQQTAALLDLPAPLREKMSSSFQLVDFQNARDAQMEDLTRLAKERKIRLAPAVLSGFPEHTADVRQPELLWVALSLISNVLYGAIECRVTEIHSLQSPLVLTNEPAAGLGRNWAEIPIQIEFSGPAESALRVLQLLPLRPAEAGAAGYSGGITNKTPIFIDRLVVRKQDPAKPDQVRVTLRAAGFVTQEF